MKGGGKLKVTVLKIAMGFPDSGLPIKKTLIPFLKSKLESIGCNSDHRKFKTDLSNLADPVCYRFSQYNSSYSRTAVHCCSIGKFQPSKGTKLQSTGQMVLCLGKSMERLGIQTTHTLCA